MTPEEKSLELSAKLRELEEEFERGLREKETLYEKLGLTPERLEAFEKKLSPPDREKLKAIQGEFEEKLAANAPVPASTAPARTVRARGIRI